MTQVRSRFPDRPAIDSHLPGDNIVVERIDGEDVYLRQDLRDTEGPWFYWCFRVLGASGRTLRFHFYRRRRHRRPRSGGQCGRRKGLVVARDGLRRWAEFLLFVSLRRERRAI